MEAKLNYAQTVLEVLSKGTYTAKNKQELYCAIKKFCGDHPNETPYFEFNHRSDIFGSQDVDLALRNLMDGKRITIEEHSGLIRIL